MHETGADMLSRNVKNLWIQESSNIFSEKGVCKQRLLNVKMYKWSDPSSTNPVQKF